MADDVKTMVDDIVRIEKLAKLSPLEYDRVRKEESERLKCRVATLDEKVEEARQRLARNGHGSAGSAGNIEWPDLNKEGKPVRSYRNAREAIQHLGVKCTYDVFRDSRTVGGQEPRDWYGDVTDPVLAMVRQAIIETFGFDPGKQNVTDAVDQLCFENRYDSVCNYLDGLTWDGTPRIDRLLVDYFGAEPTNLNLAIGSMLLRAAVRRARRPGSKFDYIVVLESPEGKNKSTAVALLAGQEYFSDQSILAASDKEQQELVRGRWFYEIAELGGMRRAEVQRVKAFASRDTDRARPAYGRCVVNAPRHCVFVGTTNDSQYLMSQTGNRRFLPVKVGTIDLDAIARDRDQLFAEAAARDAQGESIMLPESLWEAAREEQAEREAVDPWEDVLAGVCGDRFTDADGCECERVLSSYLLGGFLDIPKASRSQHHSIRLAAAMKRLGWEGPMQLKVDGKNLRGYRRPYRPAP